MFTNLDQLIQPTLSWSNTVLEVKMVLLQDGVTHFFTPAYSVGLVLELVSSINLRNAIGSIMRANQLRRQNNNE